MLDPSNHMLFLQETEFLGGNITLSKFSTVKYLGTADNSAETI